MCLTCSLNANDQRRFHIIITTLLSHENTTKTHVKTSSNNVNNQGVMRVLIMTLTEVISNVWTPNAVRRYTWKFKSSIRCRY